MPFFDMPLEELHRYRPERSEPSDFDKFWQGTLSEARQHPLDARFQPVDAGLRTVQTYDLSFAGYGGQRVKGWLLLPADAVEPLPAVVEYIGYGGGRGFPTDWLLWSAAGYAHLVMDTRGQGSNWQQGDTPDLPDGANPFTPGFMTQGILNPRHYYYRRVFTDAVRAVEAACTHPMVDAARVAVTGGSQGGGISIAVSGLIPRQVAAVLPDVPFLCHFRRAVGLTDAAPYAEIVRYLSIHRDKVEQAFQTLDYFDGMNFAVRAQAPALYSAALMDSICPPSTVFAAYNHLAAAQKEIHVYPFNEHEGGKNHHVQVKLRFLHSLWA